MLKKRLRLIILIVISLCLMIGIGLWVQKMWVHPQNVRNINKNSVGLDEAEGVTMVIPGSTSNTYWELHIHKIQSTGDIDKLSQIEGVYFINKVPFYHMSGKQGTIHLETRKLEIAGDVIVKATDGSKKLSAARMVWDSGANKILAQKNVVLETAQAIVTTEEVATDLKMDYAVFNGQTKVSYQGINQ